MKKEELSITAVALMDDQSKYVGRTVAVPLLPGGAVTGIFVKADVSYGDYRKLVVTLDSGKYFTSVRHYVTIFEEN
jgi:hypothetical protein